jgi:hypothetical protein
MAMTDRCWRKTISSGVSTREFYPSDGSTDENFVVPSVTTAFQFTIPENTFQAGSGSFVFGLFKTKAHYVFSQRRTDIGDIVETERQRIATTVMKPVNYPVVGTPRGM